MGCLMRVTTGMKSSRCRHLLALAAGVLLGMPLAASALMPLNDAELSNATGQALLISDYIAPSGIGVTDPNTQMPIGFYRMGLDATVEANVNINKLQLGCGGFNNNIKVGCDIDLDFVSMMGLNKTGSTQPTSGQKDATGGDNYNKDAGAPVTSDFLMKRPYVAIAVANPDDPAKREVVGFEFGAESVTGYMGIGRVYQNGQTNLETGEVCSSTNFQSLGCHSGLNSLSGYLVANVSGGMPVTGTALGLGYSGNTCFGPINYPGGNCSTSDPALKIPVSGTRINSMKTTMIAHSHVVAAGIITLNLDLPTTMTENLRFIHGFTVNNTSDFFLSFQRQAVNWPKYDKTGYAATANAGWWMNIPEVNTTGIIGATLEVPGNAIPTSLEVKDLELKSVPPINCYGSYQYC